MPVYGLKVIIVVIVSMTTEDGTDAAFGVEI